ncbi:MAG TPA: N-acetylneuraminate synthase family protein [Bacillota bacterium]|nr:N-acetylneuraminate synthase family protein [Bacillota bacterium]
MKQFHIGRKVISHQHPCYVIAEMGVNHNGKEALAIKLVEEAVKAGVDAIKFSRFDPYKVHSKESRSAYCLEDSCRYDSHMADLTRKMDLSNEVLVKMAQLCKKLNVDFLSTPFDENSVDFLVKLGVPAIKIGSGDLTADPFLSYVAKQKLPVVLSTGMSNMEEVHHAVTVLMENGCPELALLHCVSNFPAQVEGLNLKVIQTLEREFDVPVGFSDHTTAIDTAGVAVASGACIIEKHFTLDQALPGPDHQYSLDPHEMAQMIKEIRQVEKVLGVEQKVPTAAELEYRKFGRRSIVARVTIEPDTVITETMITLKRPGTGISPRDLYKVLGKKAKVRIGEDEILTWDKLV